MIKKLLVAVDGSSHSLKAVKVAAEVASGCDADMTILTVIKAHQSKKLSAELSAYAQLEHLGRADLDAMKSLSNDLVSHAAATASEAGVKNITKIVETGPAARTIVKIAKEKEADLIVIGSRGLGNIESTLRGGVSHRVELLAKCSVLTVK
ncbi:MAG: universal stress protein UspA [Marinosulfonomonas sp.]|nr:MAG: universal stress protein UspA [Marinosulfonomonas sp.]